MSIELLKMVLRGWFLKHNWVKSKKKTRLKLDTLDALVRVSLIGFEVEFMDWNGIFESWKLVTKTNKRKALSLQEVELDGWFSILHIVLENMYHITHAQV